MPKQHACILKTSNEYYHDDNILCANYIYSVLDCGAVVQ